MNNEKIILVVHGGAGNSSVEIGGNNKHDAQLEFLSELLTKAYAAYKKKDSALDLVEQTIIELENFPGFNSGHGSVLTNTGTVEMDASIMDGTTQKAGAVACVTRIKNPITAARTIMQETDHIFLVGQNADRYAEQHKLDMAEQAYFITKARQQELQDLQNNNTASNLSKGTVGCVALDHAGSLAAGTSTGGKVNQLPGRVGDTPIIGCGTWADKNCAFSATGDGEAIIRSNLTHTMATRINQLTEHIDLACQFGIDQLSQFGEGGCIGLDRTGNVVAKYNTRYMYRGWVSLDGKVVVGV